MAFFTKVHYVGLDEGKKMANFAQVHYTTKLKQNLQPSIHTRFISLNTKSGSGEEIGLSFSLTNSGERVLEGF
jgi:hypothetical protein